MLLEFQGMFPRNWYISLLHAGILPKVTSNRRVVTLIFNTLQLDIVGIVTNWKVNW